MDDLVDLLRPDERISAHPTSRELFRRRVLPASQGRGAKKGGEAAWERRPVPPSHRLTEKQRQYRRLYGSAKWKELRAGVLSVSAMCEVCRERLSVEVDHVLPHRGVEALFFDPENLAAVCRPCHVAKSARGR